MGELLAEMNSRRHRHGFFHFLHGQELAFGMIFDVSFLCTLRTPLRTKWADQLCALLRPGGELIALVLTLPAEASLDSSELPVLDMLLLPSHTMNPQARLMA